MCVLVCVLMCVVLDVVAADVCTASATWSTWTCSWSSWSGRRSPSWRTPCSSTTSAFPTTSTTRATGSSSYGKARSVVLVAGVVCLGTSKRLCVVVVVCLCIRCLCTFEKTCSMLTVKSVGVGVGVFCLLLFFGVCVFVVLGGMCVCCWGGGVFVWDYKLPLLPVALLQSSSSLSCYR